MGYFVEIIFSPPPRIIVQPQVVHTEHNISIMFDKLWCNKRSDWITLVECIDCPTKNKTLDELFADLVGCI